MFQGKRDSVFVLRRGLVGTNNHGYLKALSKASGLKTKYHTNKKEIDNIHFMQVLPSLIEGNNRIY